MARNIDDNFPLIRKLLKLHFKVQLGAIEINESGNFQFTYQRIKPPYDIQTRNFLNLYFFEELEELINFYAKDDEKELAFKELFKLVMLIGK